MVGFAFTVINAYALAFVTRIDIMVGYVRQASVSFSLLNRPIIRNECKMSF